MARWLATQPGNPLGKLKVYRLAQGHPTPDFTANLARLPEYPAVSITELASPADFPTLTRRDWVIDCLFGSGLNRPVTGLAALLIGHLNASGSRIVAVDVPSGLPADTPPWPAAPVVQAWRTYALELPKPTLLYDAHAPYVGELTVVPIGLHPNFLAQATTHYYWFDKAEAQARLRERARVSHKGTFGHALLLAGSPDTLGAAILSAGACLRAGAGLLTVGVPTSGRLALNLALPEAMLAANRPGDQVARLPSDLPRYQALGLGPGLGRSRPAAQLVRQVLERWQGPLVLDADALNWLAQNPAWWARLPPGCVLTPHPKEFARLVGEPLTGMAAHARQMELSERYQINLICKGATTITTVYESVTGQVNSYFNASGNAGMATAGSGDVLTGVITGLLAQGYAPEVAAPLGVYLHGLAGDLAAQARSPEALIARDLTEHLGAAYRHLREG